VSSDVIRTVDISRERVRIDDLAPRIARPALWAGAAGLAASVLLGLAGAESFFRAYLVNYGFFLALTLGALFFVLIHHATRASWSVAVRRIAEHFTGTLPMLAALSLVFLVPMVLGAPAAIHALYPWTDAAHVAGDPFLRQKTAYLNVPFFVIRLMVYFSVWCGLAQWFYTMSLRQDQSGEGALTLQMQKIAPPALIAYALTVTFAAVDLLMSLAPHWYSTIFGVYFFSGCALAFYCTLAITMYLLQGAGRLTGAITVEHYHDVGKFAFGFVVFWAYIAYSQYMLMWYANLPEETAWYHVRQQPPWLWFSLLLLFGHFMASFLVLISRLPKRRPPVLVAGAAWVLAMCWFDVFWLVLPHAEQNGVHGPPVAAKLHALDVLQCLTTLLGVGGLYVWRVVSRMGRTALLPQRDPRLEDSLAFENY